MKELSVAILMFFFVVNVNAKSPLSQKNGDAIEGFKVENISVTDLTAWSFYGKGKAYPDKGHNQFCVTESDESVGAMIVSPKPYIGDVIVRYGTLALTPATVLVVLLSISDLGETTSLTIPAGYDGNNEFWLKNTENYFFAFRNASHNLAPFLRKWPIPGRESLAVAKKDVMLPGVYHEVELGCVKNEIWLKVDGNTLFKTKDTSALKGGRIAFRTRGIDGFKGAFLMKDLRIYFRQ